MERRENKVLTDSTCIYTDIIKITTGSGRELSLALEQQVFIEAKGWLTGEKLELYDCLIDINGYQDYIVAIEPSEHKQPVYIFAVARDHNFYADGVLVHNMPPKRIVNKTVIRTRDSKEKDSKGNSICRESNTIQDKMVFGAAKSNDPKPDEYTKVKKVYDFGDMSDPKYKEHRKMEYSVESKAGRKTVMHYVEDASGNKGDFKFKNNSAEGDCCIQ